MQFKDFSFAGKKDDRPFLKLKNGQSMIGVFRGEVYDFKTHWLNNHSEKCEGETCGHCADNKARFRFRVNFLQIDENGGINPYVFEQGFQVYSKLKELHQEFDLPKTIVKLTRTGEGLDTEYSIIPTKNSHVDAVREAKLSAITLINLSHDLDSKPKPDAQSWNGDVPF